MFNLDTCGAQFVVEKIKTGLGSPAGIFSWTLATSVMGVLILLGFLAMVMAPSALPLALPLVVLFNGAAGGYGLAEKQSSFPHQKLGLISLATVLTLTGSSAIAVLCPWEPLVDTSRLFVALFWTLIGTGFGAWIARKSKSLHNNA